jgi:hypothetical protein
MATLYNVNADTKGVNGFGSPFCKNIYSATLAANTEKTLTVPDILASGLMPSTLTNQVLAVFNYTSGANVFVAVNATAAVPAGSSFAATTSELNPSAKKVKAGDVLHIISAGTPGVTVSFYSVMEN